MAAGRDQDRGQQASRHGAQNRRLTDAKTLRYILRTDQCLQVVCWDNASLTRQSRPRLADAWYFQSGAGISSSKMCSH
jgi:hypothetical protein